MHLREAALITLYGLVFEAPGVVFAMLWLVGGDVIRLNAVFFVLLAVCAPLSVFLVALIGLSRGPIDRWTRGCRLDLWAALLFYLLLLSIFAFMPALAEAWDRGWRVAGKDLAFFTWAVIANSFGLPLFLGAAGGALYGWLRGKRARLFPDR